MKKALFIREFPDGSRQIFDSPEGFKAPPGPYFDDIALYRADSSSLVSMKYGHEQSAPDRIIKDRLTNEYIFHYILGGRGRYNGQVLTANQGFVVFPSEVHSMEADENDPWHFLWLTIRGYNADYLVQNAGFSESCRVFEFRNADRLFAIFYDIIYTPHPDVDMELYMLGCFHLLMSFSKWECCRAKAGRASRSEAYCLQAKRFMQQNFAKDISVIDVARHLNISRKYLTGLFNKHERCSPQMYLINLRLNIASTLLRETLAPVAEIGRLVGYGDYTHFYKIFKRYKGSSPTVYRENSR